LAWNASRFGFWPAEIARIAISGVVGLVVSVESGTVSLFLRGTALVAKQIRILFTSLLACSLVTFTYAASQTFTNQADFLAAAGATFFESFETLIPDNSVGFGAVGTIAVPDFQIVFAGPVTSLFDTLTVVDASNEGQVATHGEQ
jgi:hypothetical protein